MSLVAVPKDVDKSQRDVQALVAYGADEKLIVAAKQNRRSGLLAPTMELLGPEGEVLTCEFSADGRSIATAGLDKIVYVYNVYGECENYRALKGHRAAILELHWSPDSSQIYTASADKCCAMWDVEEGVRIRKLGGANTTGGHLEAVMSCQVARRGPPLLCSGGDDGYLKVWDLRQRRVVKSHQHRYQILSVTFDDHAERVFAGTLDNEILVYDMRKGGIADQPLAGPSGGHSNSVTGLALSNDGELLISNGMDLTVRLWDVRPFAAKREVGVFTGGGQHNFERNLIRVRWSPDDRMFGCGSSDRFVYIWENPRNPQEARIAYKLSGHSGCVNEVVFHPTEPVVASAGSDGKVFLGELEA